jgi:hypothetical protein
METSDGPLEIYQDDETGRVKFASTVSLLLERELGKEFNGVLKPDQNMARCFKFFDSFEDMMKWMNKQNLLSSLKFTYSCECKEEAGEDEYRV